ncbi:hypothetical protein GRF29_28g427466 [Pseudopithomyces chartarum]|uniref:Uncharacterized protein n=1 Tax=Pseudopithomyces chartarum TaxID=1892770 RepID=A0AAN6M1N7_9PLEO|nr:hypothetical protein GRF29_28g427466 [Pseudopithomyces chartarum]
MRYAASFLLLGVAAAQQQYEVYTIPVFDPANAPTYGASQTTIYRPTDLTSSATQPASSATPSSPVKACKVAPTTLSTSRKTTYHTQASY